LFVGNLNIFLNLKVGDPFGMNVNMRFLIRSDEFANAKEKGCSAIQRGHSAPLARIAQHTQIWGDCDDMQQRLGRKLLFQH
jgi:hypothetical protein